MKDIDYELMKATMKNILEDFNPRETFNKEKEEYTLKRMELETKLGNPFALRMAYLICVSIVSIILMLGIFFGEKTPLVLGLTIGIAIIFGITSFSITRSGLV